MTLGNQRVLVVDDEAPIRRYLRAALGAQGLTVYESATGEEALQAVLSHRPDIIILDLGLPDIGGIEVTRRLREWSQTPIIILSVREAEQDKIAALDAGADDYLTKPFGTGELLARMRVALRKQSSAANEPVF
ncbi:MAG TPA: response regulator, partial [Anaerolineales bacterium]|nr:response regulator [Anaerolineales bacterium]